MSLWGNILIFTLLVIAPAGWGTASILGHGGGDNPDSNTSQKSTFEKLQESVRQLGEGPTDPNTWSDILALTGELESEPNLTEEQERLIKETRKKINGLIAAENLKTKDSYSPGESKTNYAEAQKLIEIRKSLDAILSDKEKQEFDRFFSGKIGELGFNYDAKNKEILGSNLAKFGQGTPSFPSSPNYFEGITSNNFSFNSVTTPPVVSQEQSVNNSQNGTNGFATLNDIVADSYVPPPADEQPSPSHSSPSEEQNPEPQPQAQPTTQPAQDLPTPTLPPSQASTPPPTSTPSSLSNTRTGDPNSTNGSTASGADAGRIASESGLATSSPSGPSGGSNSLASGHGNPASSGTPSVTPSGSDSSSPSDSSGSASSPPVVGTSTLRTPATLSLTALPPSIGRTPGSSVSGPKNIENSGGTTTATPEKNSVTLVQSSSEANAVKQTITADGFSTDKTKTIEIQNLAAGENLTTGSISEGKTISNQPLNSIKKLNATENIKTEELLSGSPIKTGEIREGEKLKEGKKLETGSIKEGSQISSKNIEEGQALRTSDLFSDKNLATYFTPLPQSAEEKLAALASKVTPFTVTELALGTLATGKPQWADWTSPKVSISPVEEKFPSSKKIFSLAGENLTPRIAGIRLPVGKGKRGSDLGAFMNSANSGPATNRSLASPQ